MTQELQSLNQLLNEETHNMSVNSSTGDNTSVLSTKSGKPKKMACVECRQQKSKCDAHERYPEPCSRCSKKNLKCDLRSDYKRTYKRARIAQIEKEFSELKKTLTSAQASELINKIPTLTQVSGINELNELKNEHEQSVNDLTKNTHNSSETNPSSIPNTPSINRTNDLYTKGPEDQDDEKITIPEYILFCEEKTLDAITLSPETIKSLYLEYVANYHPILPVVDVMKGPEKIYKLCPALFWVMMFVSLRRVHDDASRNLLLTLSPIIKDILAEITISPITRYNPTEEDEPILNACSVYSVQAFLIYTYWPPITSSLSADTSWNTIGLALFHAIRIGLNSPMSQSVSNGNNHTRTPQQLSMAHEQTKTWIVCNIVSQTIATAFGFPAFVQFDSSIWSSLRSSSPMKISKSVRFMLEIALFSDQTAKTLNSNPMDTYGLIDPTERLPLLKILIRQLDELEIKLVDELPSNDSYRKFQLLQARVNLLTYYFMDSSRIAFFELQKGLVRLYNSAISLINFAHLCTSRDKNFIKYLPGVYVLGLWQASCIIAKLIHSPLKKSIDIGSGKQSYQAAITLAAKASILKHDMAHRSSGIMRNMWQVLRSLDEKKLSTLTIDIRSRMSASVFFDCLYLLRDQVGMLKLNSRNDTQEAIEGDDNEGTASNEDDEEYGYQENETAVESDEEDKANGTGTSQKSTPGSNASSRTRKTRSLSNTVNAESKARKIIRTIPLDPQPISVNNKRSTIFKVIGNSNESSPRLKPEGLNDHNRSSNLRGVSNSRENNIHREGLRSQINSPPPLLPNHLNRMAIAGNIINRSVSNQKLNQQDVRSPNYNSIPPQFQSPTYSSNSSNNVSQVKNVGNSTVSDNKKRTEEFSFNQMVLNDSPYQGALDNLEIDNMEISSDLLWKDVDSVMNDFGFHTH